MFARILHIVSESCPTLARSLHLNSFIILMAYTATDGKGEVIRDIVVIVPTLNNYGPCAR